MRLLITNTRYSQAYSIIRALRPHARRVVATVDASPIVPLRSHAAFSRLVDARYRVPDPERDWRGGRVQRENTPGEDAFIDRILEICRRESIDVVFPSADPWVYVLSKNKHRFDALGITIPVPDFEILQTPLDKYQTVRLAERADYPTPVTELATSDEAVEAFSRRVSPPWVLKPRCTMGSHGMAIVSDRRELLERTRRARVEHGAPLVQEYIPGREKRNFYLVADHNSEIVSCFSPRVLRYSRRLYRGMAAACESGSPDPVPDELRQLVHRLGWWGGMAVQTKIDGRDGTPKLMEINPRLGRALWYRTALGLNEPLMTLTVARGEPLEAAPQVPQGRLLLQPIEDAFGLVFECLDLASYRVRTDLLGREPLDRSNAPLGLAELLRGYREQYFGNRRRCYSPYVRHALSDPLPALGWCYMIARWYLGAALRGELGR